MNDYPEIRASLVAFARGTDRPQALKDHAEVLVTIIDAMAKDPDDTDLKPAFFKAYQRFYRAASGEPLPVALTPGEIAAAFGLLDPDTHQQGRSKAMTLVQSPGDAVSRPERHRRSCEAMADLLSREFQANISDEMVAEIFDRYWRRLSDLAHSIHSAGR